METSKKSDTQELKIKIIELLKIEPAHECDDVLKDFKKNLNEEKNLRPFSELLEAFVHMDFSEEEAKEHWEGIIFNAEDISKKLNRKIGIHLAIVDYFTNMKKIFESPMLVEVHVFKQTEKMAMMDALTGLFNRRYMNITLNKEVARCHRYGKIFSVIMFDVDDFKKANDEKGHLFGDRVLQEVATILKNTVRNEDIVCRYGGEEFLVVLPETDFEGAFKMGCRIREEIAGFPFMKKNTITVSGGVATFPAMGNTEELLLGVADKSLYQAKSNGKNRIC